MSLLYLLNNSTVVHGNIPSDIFHQLSRNHFTNQEEQQRRLWANGVEGTKPADETRKVVSLG